MKLRTLKKHALDACKFRGHAMSKFFWAGDGNAWAQCKCCSKQVWLCENPAPNGIDIAGEAVALSCVD